VKVYIAMVVLSAFNCASDAARGQWVWAVAQSFLCGLLIGAYVIARAIR
jgi:hypothetical protein